MTKLFKKENLLIHQRVEDWKEAVTLSGALLEASGAVHHDYVKSMIENVLQFGPYIVIAPGIAIAHAEPSESVYENAMSLLCLREPVAFGSANDPVHLVFSLASVDGSSHLQSLQELVRLLCEAETVERLKTSKDVEEQYKILNGFH